MIAVTSHKPFIADPDYAILQKKAFQSWLPHFEKIVFMGKHEPDLASSVSVFAESEQFPKIKILAEVASVLNSNAVIINSDIVLTKDFSLVKNMFNRSKYVAGTSKRLEFDPESGGLCGTMKDHGLDVFIGRPQTWSLISRHVPDKLRIGHHFWDAWMVGFMNKRFKELVCDFSSFKCVLHPEHEGRVRPYQDEIQIKDEFFAAAGMPSSKLR